NVEKSLPSRYRYGGSSIPGLPSHHNCHPFRTLHVGTLKPSGTRCSPPPQSCTCICIVCEFEGGSLAGSSRGTVLKFEESTATLRIWPRISPPRLLISSRSTDVLLTSWPCSGDSFSRFSSFSKI